MNESKTNTVNTNSMNHGQLRSTGDTARLFAGVPFQPPQRVAPYALGAARTTYRIDCRGTVRDPDFVSERWT